MRLMSFLSTHAAIGAAQHTIFHGGVAWRGVLWRGAAWRDVPALRFNYPSI